MNTLANDAILLGDSIRIGYQPVVERELAAEFNVWAPDTNCHDTRKTLAHLDEWVAQRVKGREDRAVVHLNCGLHDLKFTDADNKPAQTPHVPLEEYKQNLQRILGTLLNEASLPPTRIIWALTTPVIDQRHLTKGFIRRQADVENYNAVASAVCKQLGIPVHDLHALVVANEPERIITPDGVHYTDAGQEVLGRAVAARLRSAVM